MVMVAQVRGAESPLAKLNAMTGVLGAVIGIVGLFLTYMATASQVHWPPFARPAIQRPPISSRPPTLSPTPRLPGAAPTPPSSASTPSGWPMAVGTCVDLPPSGNGGETLVNCAYPHDAELDSIRKAPSNDYPGSAVLSNQASSWCKNDLRNLSISAFMAQTYRGINYTVPTSYFNAYPSAASWASGSREEYCFFKGSNGQQLNGSFLGN
jgi:hypothetical protein